MLGRIVSSMAGGRRLGAPVMALALLVLPVPAGAADPLPADAFYGHYQGSGVAENADSLYFGVTVRDIDVRIGPREGGFVVEWTSVIRTGGDPDKPDVRRRTDTLAFVPGGAPGVFEAPEAQNPRSPRGLVWARIAGQTLTVNVMRITAGGGYVIQTYDRTLDGNGMHLQFTSVSDGEARRQVDARLVKVGD